MDLTPGIIRAVLESLPALSLPIIFVETECIQTKDDLDEIDVTTIWERYKEVEWRRPIAEARFRDALAGFPIHHFEDGTAVLYGYRWRSDPPKPQGFPWARLHAMPRGSASNLFHLASYLQLERRQLDKFRNTDPKIFDACEIALGRKPTPGGEAPPRAVTRGPNGGKPRSTDS